MKARNYARFYVLFEPFAHQQNREELKGRTWDKPVRPCRTDSLREMTAQEYNDMCEAMQQMDQNRKVREIYREQLRQKLQWL